MAFDRPLEADRVEDLGFLSSFVRAPVIGTIMWMFGGDAAKKREEEEQTRDMQTMLEAATEDETGAFDTAHSFDKENDIDVVKHMPFGHKLTPDLTGSDLSEMSDGDCTEDLLEEHSSNNFSSLKSNRELTSSLRLTGSKRNLTRRVSFKDFSDQSLDKSFNEVSSIFHTFFRSPSRGGGRWVLLGLVLVRPYMIVPLKLFRGCVFAHRSRPT
eukprot:scaffold60718_cov59-Attheya_sp.AAC.5